jgi:hypothetical protein
MYNQEITRSHRAAFVLLLDRSASMQQHVRFGKMTLPKSQVVAYTANTLITELLDRCRRTDGIRNYYDIAVIGYCGDKVESLLCTEGFASVKELSTREPSTSAIAFEQELEDGSTLLTRHHQKNWIEPLAEGTTPMYEALHKALNLVEEWCEQPQNQDSFPPIVINITDGEATDCGDNDLRDVCSLIKRTSTSDGDTLLLNIHICSDNSLPSVIFPMQEEISLLNHKARLLADCSSTMPSVLDNAIHDLKGVGAIPPFVGMGYNTSVVELLSMINIGSRSITQLE